MMLVRACSLGASPILAGCLRTSTIRRVPLPRFENVRLFANEGRGAFTRFAHAKETILEKGAKSNRIRDSARHIGAGVLASASLLGIGALAYYGLGLSSKPGAIDRSLFWPQYVQDRIQSTYMYLASSIGIGAASAALALRSPKLRHFFVFQGRTLSFVALFLLLMGTSTVACSIPYEKGINVKHLAWLAHSGVMGAMVAPLYFLGGPVLLRAACYTAGVVLSLSTIAVCSPSDQFLQMGGPLAVGLGIIFASSMASMFLPPSSALGFSMHAVALYGGLVLFSLFLLYDTQKLINLAEMTPPSNDGNSPQFDPIRCSIHLYMDIINIFLRLVSLGGGRSK